MLCSCSEAWREGKGPPWVVVGASVRLRLGVGTGFRRHSEPPTSQLCPNTALLSAAVSTPCTLLLQMPGPGSGLGEP